MARTIRFPWRVSLRTKLALLALILLTLPWVGYRYVQGMERFLLEAQQQSLLDTARAVATALHGRPQLMRLSPPNDSEMRRAAEEELKRLAELSAATNPAAEEGSASVEPSAAAAGSPPLELARESAPPNETSASEDIAAILRALERNPLRIWVVNRELRVLALSGSLKAAAPNAAAPLWQRAWERLLARLPEQPTEDFDDALDDDVLATGKDIANALQGAPATRTRKSRDARAVIVSAAYPIWDGDNVLGAVVVEETTHSIVSLRNRALEQLLGMTLAVFGVAALVLLWFATRLSGRIRRLRDAAESAADARGRIAAALPSSSAGDEIGDLSRTFATLMARLAQHHGYLESMASRLSHELRTPITVVRSSLENLRLQPLPPQAQVYMERAEDGLQRLSKILSRMSEASRLEQAFQAAERERFDFAELVRNCLEGYRLAYPGRAFELHCAPGPVPILGAPDLAAQMLDKLIANAADFAADATPIHVSLEVSDNWALLRVANKGPLLPEAVERGLFESMVSVRNPRGDGEPHLGLGLYVARLIAEFHRGTIRADNIVTKDGVCVSVTLPLA